MALCFLFSNPPGASPDEGAHYLRAMGVGRGQFVLDQAERRPAPPELAHQMEWMWMQSGTVRLPENLSITPFECWSYPFYVGSCEEKSAPKSQRTAVFETYVGTYPPFTYLLPGLFMRAADDSVTALMLGRAAGLLVSLTLISGAVLALYQRDSRLCLAGVVCTVSPMVLVTAASLTSSGIEVAAAICFFACLLRTSRSAGAPPWVWIMAGVSGATMIVSRELGPVWGMLHLGLILISTEWRRLRTAWSRGGKPAWIFLGSIVVASAVALAWRAAESIPPDLSRIRFPDFGLDLAGGIARQVVGVFGPLDALMPDLAYRIWGAMVAALIVTALFSGTRRQRAALAVAVLVVVVAGVGLEAVQNIYGFGVQARHFMPAVICIPLLAGEMIARGPRPRWASKGFFTPVLAVAAAAVHLTSWHTLGRRFAVGADGPAIFLRAAEWSPPGGWIAWGVIMSIACLALMLPFLAAQERS